MLLFSFLEQDLSRGRIQFFLFFILGLSIVRDCQSGRIQIWSQVIDLNGLAKVNPDSGLGIGGRRYQSCYQERRNPVAKSRYSGCASAVSPESTQICQLGMNLSGYGGSPIQSGSLFIFANGPAIWGGCVTRRSIRSRSRYFSHKAVTVQGGYGALFACR